MGATRLLTVLGAIAAAWPLYVGADEAPTARTIIQGLPPPAAAQPPLCSEREHLGRTGYLVDQAWQVYRRLERSSPARVGWCGCAKQCEPIDKLAAEYENVAFEAKAASVDPGIPPDQREEYGELSIEMFGKRNETVEKFNDCLDATRPPLSPPRSLSLRGPTIPGHCEKFADNAWGRWCKKIDDQMRAIYAEFYLEFQVRPKGRFWIAVPLRATPDGTLKIHGQPGWEGLTQDQIDDYKKKIAAVKAGPFPKGSKLQEWIWTSEMEVNKDGKKERTWRKPMDCPDEDLPDD